jgi:tetratricopeptide (TPR) repeat protein
MVGDLKDKLEPIGRLDALDGVGARVLAYYQKEGTADLSDESLSQRSRALSLMGEVAYARGDLEGSLRLYHEAMTGTAEAIHRNPKDPQSYYDHAQNIFYIGQIAHQRGDFRTAEADMREYQGLADRMIALGPDNMKWRMEKQYADFNLAVALYDQRRFSEAAGLFQQCLTTMQAIATADPGNMDYQQEVGEALTWLADAERSLGNYREAIAARKRDILAIQRLFAETGSVEYQQRLIPAHRTLGALYAEQGQNDLAVQEFRAAVAQADALVPKEPANSVSQEYSYSARFFLAYQLLPSGNRDEAAALVDDGCATVSKLLQRKNPKPGWRSGLGSCWAMKARLALAGGSKDEALKFAQSAVSATKAAQTGDAVSDAYELAGRYLLVGNIQHELGNEDAARSAWSTALSQLPGGFAEPKELATRAAILDRLGRTAEAQPLHARLNAMGYKQSAS